MNYFFNAIYLGINIRKAVSCIMYKKALRLSQKSKAESSTGKMVTIVSSELQTIDWGIQMVPFIIIAPISTVIAFGFIALDFKEGAAIGFVGFVLIMLAQMMISKATQVWKYNEGKFSDKRIDIITDSVNGARTIKIYGWETPFQNLIRKWRNIQLKYIGLSHCILSFGFSIFQN
jgi:ABC-type multidrug transport system fused ATPase/permease subunit